MSASSSSAAAAAAASSVDGKQEIADVPKVDAKRKHDERDEFSSEAAEYTLDGLLVGNGDTFYALSHKHKLGMLQMLHRHQDEYGSEEHQNKIGAMIMCTPGVLHELPALARTFSPNKHISLTLRSVAMCEHDAANMKTLGSYVDKMNSTWLSKSLQASTLLTMLALDGHCFTNIVLTRRHDPAYLPFFVEEPIESDRRLVLLATIMVDDARTLAGNVKKNAVDEPIYHHRAFLVFKGDTLLHAAARFGRHRVYSWLLENGADHEAKNSLGETPAELYAQNGGNRSVKAARKT